jgi:hypothetical protein
MAWIVVRSFAVSIAIALAGNCLSLAQTSGRPAPSEPPAGPQYERITYLIGQLADQARTSEDIAFAVRAQAQAASLLWGHDRDRAREIYRRAFETIGIKSSGKRSGPGGPALTDVERQQLRSELLGEIVTRDAELAEQLARALADSGPDCSGGSPANDCAAASLSTAAAGDSPFRGVEQRELLISLALQLADRDPQRAMAMGQLSIASGISPNLPRLLLLMRSKDAALADLLFSNAVARLEKAERAALTEIQSLGRYLVTLLGPSVREPLNRSTVLRFINLAFSCITRNGASPASDEAASRQTSRLDEPSALYFICRQLSELCVRFMPDRAEELQRKLAELAESVSAGHVFEQPRIVSTAPVEIAREARLADDDAERDRLTARAALAWLAKGEMREAQAAALKVFESGLRDRVLMQILRRNLTANSLDDALAIAHRIEDGTERVDALVTLAGAALRSGIISRATEILNEAEKVASGLRPLEARALCIWKVAGVFSSFDMVRGFEVTQAAVKAVNDAVRLVDNGSLLSLDAGEGSEAPGKMSLDQLHEAGLEQVLTALARSDFERALYLAQQIATKETSVVAQLAVCRGGLSQQSAQLSPQSDSADRGGDLP